MSTSRDIGPRWVLQNPTDDRLTLVQAIAWCRQVTSHYLSQCWPQSMSPYDVTRRQWVYNDDMSNENNCYNEKYAKGNGVYIYDVHFINVFVQWYREHSEAFSINCRERYDIGLWRCQMVSTEYSLTCWSAYIYIYIYSFIYTYLYFQSSILLKEDWAKFYAAR